MAGNYRHMIDSVLLDAAALGRFLSATVETPLLVILALGLLPSGDLLRLAAAHLRLRTLEVEEEVERRKEAQK